MILSVHDVIINRPTTYFIVFVLHYAIYKFLCFFEIINKTYKMILNTGFKFIIVVDYSYEAQRVMERTTQCEG